MNLFFRRYWKKLLLVLLLFAVALRLGSFFAALDYDEIWTLEFFSGKPVSAIFQELALPNNQPLNSLWVKLAVDAGLPLWAVRLHSLAAGVLSVLLVVALGTRLGGSRRAGFWSGVFLLCSAPCVVYSQQARGYALQLFFLLLVAWGLSRPPGRRYRYAAPAAVAAGGLYSVLTLSTSVLFLGAIVLGYFIMRPKLPEKSILAVLGAGLLFCALWYGFNLEQFRSGQQFGTVISTPAEMMRFSFATLEKVIPLEWCFLLIPGVLLAPRRLGPAVLCGMTVVLLAALITRGGPVRVYIPFAAGAALLCGAGVDRLCRRFPGPRAGVIAAAALVLAVSGFFRELPRWRFPDWYALFAEGARQGSDTLVIYPATSGFPIMWNNRPRSVEENSARVTESGKLRKLLLFSCGNELNGTDRNHSEKVLPLKTPGTPAGNGTLYALERIGCPGPGDEVLLITAEGDPLLDRAFADDLEKSGKFLRLNIFFEEKTGTGRVSVIRGGRLGPEGAVDWKNQPEQLKVFRIKQVSTGKGRP